MDKPFSRFRSYATIAALALWSIVPLGAPAPALASGTTITGANSYTGTYGTATPINNLQLADSGNPTTQVRLTVSNGTLAMSTTTGLTFTGGTSGAQLKFSGTVSNLNAALATLAYTRTAAGLGTDTLEVTLVGANQVYNPTNGHLYEYITTDGLQTWTAAKALADARTASGAAGYLATMTSTEENTYVSDRLTGPGWMGASDAAVEGAWKWVDGPETGTQFWSGRAANYSTPGAPVGGQYNNWNTGEPNDSGSNEDCGQFLGGSGGQWNDLPCTVSTLAGYVVEYGAPGALPGVASKTIALTTTGTTHNVATCTQLQSYGADTTTRFDTFNLTADIDCTGINFVPLYSSDGFFGTLDGHNHSISHVTVNQPGNCEIGFFSQIFGGTVENLTLASGSVSGDCNAGGIVGYTTGLTLDNVHSHLDILAGGSENGGLIGELDAQGLPALIRNSSAQATVNGDYAVGGLVGYASAYNGSQIVIESSFTGGTVNLSTGGSYVGGLIGITDVESTSAPASMTIQDTYSQADVFGASGTYYAGGLVGYVYQQNDGGSGHTTALTITRSYASGHVTGGTDVGGFIGYLDGPDSHATVTLSHNFSASPITSGSPTLTGGFAGFYNLTSVPVVSTDNFYDQTITGQTNCAGTGGTAFTCTAKTESSYFKNNSTNAPMTAWDFSTIWVTNPGTYPTFGATDDGDNVSTVEENAGPNSGDANNDGILDSVQPAVASFPDAVSGHYAVLQSSCGGLFNVAVGAESTAAGQTDVAYNYPGGLIRFVATGCTPGATATITQYFYGLSNPAQFVIRKSNSTTHTYTTVPGATFSMVTISGKSALKAVYHITDGSSLDQDGTVDGTIVDPAGPAVNVLGVPNTGLGGLRR